jgi:hypothetical protein
MGHRVTKFGHGQNRVKGLRSGADGSVRGKSMLAITKLGMTSLNLILGNQMLRETERGELQIGSLDLGK